jgi:hypothetical protein
MWAFRSVVVSVVFVALTAIPASAWHGSGDITAIAIHPLTPTTLYAGSSDRGVFKSTDAGTTWSATALTGIFVTVLAIDPRSPSTVYAGTQDGGVFKSIDEGTTWSTTGLTTGAVSILAIDSVNPTTLYALHSNGLLKSADGGATWNVILGNQDYRPEGYVWSVAALALDPVMPSTVYVGTVYADAITEYTETWKSKDAGASWSVISESLHPLAIEHRTDPLAAATLYAESVSYSSGCHGVFKSLDGGASWTATGLIDTPDVGVCVADLQLDPASPATVYAASTYAGLSGVSKSVDGGATWRVVNSGLTDTLATFGLPPVVGVIAIDPVTSSTLYAGTAAGLFKSTNGAESWSPTGLFQHSPLVSVGFSPSSVTGGGASTGTVRLLTPAPEGGAVVTLANNHPEVATVPAAVTVPAGTTSVTFTVSTSAVTNSTAVGVSATFDDATRSTTLVVAPALAGVRVSPSRVIGGTASTGSVGLGAPAPPGGAVVTLASSNTAVATVPPSVMVAEGQTLANFTVSTNAVGAATAVTISGSYGGYTRSAVLTIVPTTLSTLSLNPTSVIAGSTSTGTVTLTVPAPADGAVVTLSSSNTAVATVPASVTVAAGATSATFTVSTSPVLPPTYAQTFVTILAANGGETRYVYLDVTLSPLSSVALIPSSVIGGGTATGTVILREWAPPGGAVVALSSSDTSVVTIPATVTVAAGATSSQFPVSTTGVTSSTAVTISATFGGATKSAVLTVTPEPLLSSVSVKPTTVRGGSSATGTVTLSRPAPTGGAVITLSSSNPAVATAPESVTVAVGATSATFTVSTSRVTASTTVTISAAFDGVTRSAGLSVTAGKPK